MPEPVDSAKHALLNMWADNGPVSHPAETANRIVDQLVLDRLMPGDDRARAAKEIIRDALGDDRRVWESMGDLARHAIAALYNAGYTLA